MNTDFRNRVVLPVVLPIGVLLTVAVVVGGLALVMLYNTRMVALTIALVVAAGFMVAFSLANAVDEQDMTLGRRGVIVLAGLLPLLAGAGISVWAANGGVPAEELNINAVPHLSAPEGALIGAQNAENFCNFDEAGETCTDSQEATFPAQPDAETFAFVFNNLQAGTPHNVQLFTLAAGGGQGDAIFTTENGSEVVTGPVEITYEVASEEEGLFEEGAQFYYNCVVHPAMQGTLTIGPPAENA